MSSSNNTNEYKVKMIVDIIVSMNGQIKAANSETQTLIPNKLYEKTAYLKSVDWFRINKRQFGELKGKALLKAEMIIDKYGGINIQGDYGSIEIDEKDFLPFDMEEYI